MRVFVLPVAVLVIIASGYSDEPSEAQMRRAFETSLALQVRSALDFVAETDGAQAAQKIQQAGGDRFTVRSLRKRACTRAAGSYMCSFAVDVELTTGPIERLLNGRFAPRPGGGLAFIEA